MLRPPAILPSGYHLPPNLQATTTCLVSLARTSKGMEFVSTCKLHGLFLNFYFMGHSPDLNGIRSSLFL